MKGKHEFRGHPALETPEVPVPWIRARFCWTVFMLLIVWQIAGCSVRVQYPETFPSQTMYTQEVAYWFWGLAGEQRYEVYDLCSGGRVFEIHTHTSGSQYAWTLLTIGIYSPRQVTIVCAAEEEGDDLNHSG